MMISLLHPSRGRPQKSFNTVNKWIEQAGTSVELILSIDESDTKKHEYAALYTGMVLSGECVSLVNNNNSVVEATNVAARHAKGDIMLYLSDDFDCFDNWGQAILNAVKNFPGEWLLKVDDCLQRFEVPVLTIPIMSRGLYNRLGYFWHPDYKSMFVDEDLYWTCKKLNVMHNAPWIKFPHHHVSNGKATNDETYTRSAANWNQGKLTFQKRKIAGFPL